MMAQMFQPMKLPLVWVTLSKRLFLYCILMSLSLPVVQAEVFYAKDEALAMAFPGAEEVKQKSYILTEEQIEKAQSLGEVKIKEELFTLYRGITNGVVTGYAAIETQIVRTHPETLLIVLTPEGKVSKVVVLAFHEPPEYLPGERWLAQFSGKDLSAKLAPGKDVHGIFGSTLSTQATSGAVRKVLGLYQILIGADA